MLYVTTSAGRSRRSRGRARRRGGCPGSRWWCSPPSQKRHSSFSITHYTTYTILLLYYRLLWHTTIYYTIIHYISISHTIIPLHMISSYTSTFSGTSLSRMSCRSAQVKAHDARAQCWNIGIACKRAYALSSYALTYVVLSPAGPGWRRRRGRPSRWPRPGAGCSPPSATPRII